MTVDPRNLKEKFEHGVLDEMLSKDDILEVVLRLIDEDFARNEGCPNCEELESGVYELQVENEKLSYELETFKGNLTP